MKKYIKKKHIGEILQHIYDSEIHLRIGWLWDGGMDYSLGTTGFDLWDGNKANIIETGEEKLLWAFEFMIFDIVQEYPNSDFTKWFIKKFGNPLLQQ